MECNKDNSSRNTKEGLSNITINDGYNEYDEFGDTRNKKLKEKLVLYDIKHSKNYSDRLRRYNIKTKKEFCKEENNKRENDEGTKEKEEKSRKRIIKNNKKDENYGNNMSKNTHVKIKKSKKPKKDRVRF